MTGKLNIDEDRARELISLGLSMTEISRCMNVSRMSLYRKFGGEIFNKRSRFMDYRRMIEDLSSEDSIELLLMILETDKRENHKEEMELVVLGLTVKERMIVNLLKKHTGTPVTKQRIYDHIYSDRLFSDQSPEIKIIDVYICKIRKKIAPSRIETIWGFGYIWPEQ